MEPWDLIIIGEFAFMRNEFHSAGLARIDERSQRMRKEMEQKKMDWPEKKWPVFVTLFLNKPGQDLFKLNIKGSDDDDTVTMFTKLLYDMGSDVGGSGVYEEFLREKFGISAPVGAVDSNDQSSSEEEGENGGKEDPPAQ